MSKGNLCVCLNNYFENSQGNCVCTPPSKVQNGICVHNPTSCGENEYIVNQGIYKKCECKPGTFRLKDKCIACGENQQFDYGLQKCVCNQGTVQDGENCYKCRENQTFNIAYKTCDCIFGYQKNKEGDCIVCPALTFYDEDTDACECIFNYYKVGSQCLRCTNPNQGPKCYVIEYSDDQFFT